MILHYCWHFSLLLSFCFVSFATRWWIISLLLLISHLIFITYIKPTTTQNWSVAGKLCTETSVGIPIICRLQDDVNQPTAAYVFLKHYQNATPYSFTLHRSVRRFFFQCFKVQIKNVTTFHMQLEWTGSATMFIFPSKTQVEKCCCFFSGRNHGFWLG